MENSKHDHLHEPATLVGTANNRTPPAISSQKHPLDSPICLYVLQMISEIEASVIRSSEERSRNSKIQNIEKIKQPNFDLGEEFQSPIKANVVKPNPVVQSTRVKCLDLVKDIKVRVSQYLFSFRGDPNFPIFELPDGSCMSRIVMESLILDTWVAIDVLSAWSIVLNHEEELKSKDVPNRDDDMLKPEADIMKGYKQFEDMMQLFNNRWDQDDDFRKAPLVCFPLCMCIKAGVLSFFCYDHYFLFVFDLKKNKVHIIENRKWMVLEDYGILPQLMVRYLSTYLTTIKNPFGARIRNEVPKVTRMTCQTKKTELIAVYLLCAIWRAIKAVRLPNTIPGCCGSRRNNIMRKKYATKIIMCQLNKLINVVLTEANEFGKIGAAEMRAILVQAYRNREERMKLL
ncbi:hypothetical protein LXL04_034065 [Taraxacum kok-saghyz]